MLSLPKIWTFIVFCFLLSKVADCSFALGSFGLTLTIFGSLVGANLSERCSCGEEKQIKWTPRGKRSELGPSRRSANTWGWHIWRLNRKLERYSLVILFCIAVFMSRYFGVVNFLFRFRFSPFIWLRWENALAQSHP